MNCCAALGLVAVSGPAGIVEMYYTCIVQLAEIQLGATVSQVCFTNVHRDLLACFSRYLLQQISGRYLHYLPVRFLRQVLHQAPCDDLFEDAVPFLSHTSSYYDSGLVPRMLLKPAEKNTRDRNILHFQQRKNKNTVNRFRQQGEVKS